MDSCLVVYKTQVVCSHLQSKYNEHYLKLKMGADDQAQTLRAIAILYIQALWTLALNCNA